MAQCATTALVGAVPRPCVRGARGRLGGLGPVPGVVSLPFPPSRPACPALRVAGRPVRVSLTLARWYAIPRGLCVPRAWSGCPSGSPHVPFACVCARAPAASPPPLGGVACAPCAVPALGAGRAVLRGSCPSACPAPVPCSVWRAWGGAVRSRFPPTWLRAVRPPWGGSVAFVCRGLGWGGGGGGRAPCPLFVRPGGPVGGGSLCLVPRSPAFLAGRRGPPPTCCGCRCAGVGARHCPLGLPALWELRAAGVVGGRPRGGWPATIVRGVWCQTLSLPQPPALWGGQPGFRDPCVPGAVGAGVGTEHRPHSMRPCGPALLAVRVAEGRPQGGAFHCCEGRLMSGASPPPTARPLGGLLGSTTNVLWARACGCGGPTPSHWPACPVGAACRGGGGGPSPVGLACCCCEGRLVSGAVPPAAARPLGRAAGVPRPVCSGCGRCGRSTACALAGGRCSLWGWQKGVPGGDAFHRCEGRLRSGAPDCPPTGQAVGVRHPHAVGAGVWVWGPITAPLTCMPCGGCVPRWWRGAVPGGGGLPPLRGASGVRRCPSRCRLSSRAGGLGPATRVSRVRSVRAW